MPNEPRNIFEFVPANREMVERQIDVLDKEIDRAESELVQQQDTLARMRDDRERLRAVHNVLSAPAQLHTSRPQVDMSARIPQDGLRMRGPGMPGSVPYNPPQ